MSSKMLLSALAAVAAVAVIASPQDPTFEYPAAKHVGFDVPKDDSVQGTQNTDRVSVSFKNATIREVLDWLKSQGINFVVGDDQVNKDGRINISVMNQPVESFMKSLAGAWGGNWEKRNDIWVFRKGSNPFGEGTAFPAHDGAKNPFTTLDGSIKFDPLLFEGQSKMSKEQAEALQKSLGHIDARAMEEFQKRMEVLSRDQAKAFQNQGLKYKFDESQMKEMEKHFQDMERSGAFKSFKFAPDQKGFIFDGKNFKPIDEKEMQKHFQELEKSGAFKNFKYAPGQDGSVFGGKDFKPFDEKQLKEMEKRAADMAKQSKNFQYFSAPDGKGFIFDGKAMKPMTEKEKKALRDRIEKSMRDGAKAGRTFTWDSDKSLFGGGPNVGMSASAHNLKAIYDSLTPAQEQKMKRLGYINYSDLNSKQRALLGVVTDDSWTISYKTDKAEITIKSDR